MPKTPLGQIFFRSLSLFLLITFSFHQIAQAFPATSSLPNFQITEKLRSLNSHSAFERFLREEYGKDDKEQKTEHRRRKEEIQQIIASVYAALQSFRSGGSVIASPPAVGGG